MSETMPLTPEHEAALREAVEAGLHGPADIRRGPDGFEFWAGGRMWFCGVGSAELRHLMPWLNRTQDILAALAEAQREAKNANEVRAAIEKLAESQERKVRDEWAARDRSLAAAQANARTLREAILNEERALASMLSESASRVRRRLSAALSAPADESELTAVLRDRDALFCRALLGQDPRVIEAITREFNRLRPDGPPRPSAPSTCTRS